MEILPVTVVVRLHSSMGSIFATTQPQFNLIILFVEFVIIKGNLSFLPTLINEF